MPLITLDKACLAFGHVPLLDRVDLALDGGERVALIGRNGSGKTSLLKAIAGTQALDDGAVRRSAGVRIALVAQEPELDVRHTVYEAVAHGAGDLHRQLLEYHELSQRLAAEGAHDQAALERLQHLHLVRAEGDRDRRPKGSPSGRTTHPPRLGGRRIHSLLTQSAGNGR